MTRYVMSIDQGTTGSTVMLLDRTLEVKGRANCEYPQIYPRPGWVEHDPEAIWRSVQTAIKACLQEAGVGSDQIAAIGITNQRETTVVWDRQTGQPIYNAIVWQCRRTADLCRELKEAGLESRYREKTGLVLDPYFSGTKVRWILDHVEGARAKAEAGELCFGTIDTYLVWRLTGGKSFVTDVSNASRTLLMDLHTLQWSEDLCGPLRVPMGILPSIRSNAEVYGHTVAEGALPSGIPIAGMAGDQQSALFGQACFSVGDAKCTYGTGAFLLVNTGNQPIPSEHGLLTTVAWQLQGQPAQYALEGSVFIAGAAVQWLRDQMKFIPKSPESEELAASVEDSGGVIFVPALTGLGAPHWNPDARGLIWGITRGTNTAHLARATLEGIAFMTHDVLTAMASDLGKPITGLKVDGGAAQNNLMMQFQSDLLQAPIVRPQMLETTALGAAFLAGLGAGLWSSTAEIIETWKEDRTFSPKMDAATVQERLALWHKVVRMA